MVLTMIAVGEWYGGKTLCKQWDKADAVLVLSADRSASSEQFWWQADDLICSCFDGFMFVVCRYYDC